MRKSFTLSIPRPFHEKWEESNPVLRNFYTKRSKEAVEYTTWNNDPITSFFKTKSQFGQGRYFPTQLKNYIAIEENAPAFKWFPFSLLSVTLLFSSRYTENSKEPKLAIVSDDEKVRPMIDSTMWAMRIQGIVKYASDQSPLPGVNITLKGTPQTTITDSEGRFSIDITDPQPADCLLFSFTGLENTSYNLYESIDLSVYMKDDFNLVSETIAVGNIHLLGLEFRNLWRQMKNLFAINYDRLD